MREVVMREAVIRESELLLLSFNDVIKNLN